MKKIIVVVGFLSLLNFLGCATLPVEEKAEKHREKGGAHLEKREFDRAIIEFNKAIKIYPDFARAYYNRGMANQNLNRLDLALSDYRKALEIDPNFIRANFANASIAAILFHRNDHVNAEIYADRSLAIDPNNQVALDIKNRIGTARARAEQEEARRIAQEQERRQFLERVIIAPSDFDPTLFTSIDLFRAVSDSRNLERASNRQEALSTYALASALAGTAAARRAAQLNYSDLTFVRQDGLDITFSSDQNDISQTMSIDQRSGLQAGQRVRVYYIVMRAPLIIWEVRAITRR